MEEKIIGILGGMGPRSTAPFLDLVISQCQIQYNAKENKDFPHIMIYSLPAPLYLDRPINHQEMSDSIEQGLQKLVKMGVNFIAMPCNTAHRYYEELSQNVNVPLLNIVEETMREFPTTTKKVALLATRMTIETGLYQKGIGQRGIELIQREEWQQKIDQIIAAIQQLPNIPSLENEWEELTKTIYAEGVDSIILGCTDLNVVSSKTVKGLFVIDATKCLAQAVVRNYLNSSKKATV